MNCRWKTRNSTSSGPTTITLPAVTSGYCAPISPNWISTASPTVSGRLAVLLVTISGHKKSFQSKLIVDNAKAISAGRAGGNGTHQLSAPVRTER